MVEISQTLLIVSAFLGILGLFIGVIAYFKILYHKQTLEFLRQDRDDANARAEGYKEDLTRANVKISDLQGTVLNQETLLTEKSQEIHVLRNVVTGKDQLDRIEKLLTSLAEGKFGDASVT